MEVVLRLDVDDQLDRLLAVWRDSREADVVEYRAFLLCLVFRLLISDAQSTTIIWLNHDRADFWHPLDVVPSNILDRASLEFFDARLENAGNHALFR